MAERTVNDIPDDWRDADRSPFHFIVVGAGAGGSPLAARLVERGYTVLVVEMGPEGNRPDDATSSPVVENTNVPLLHPETTEDPRHSLRYFVKHFDHDPAGSQDPKVHDPSTSSDPLSNRGDDHGIFYPRAQGLGGCTIHNAMITVCAPSEDWDEIADATRDPSWSGERMRAYFERLERCHYARPATLWSWLKGRLGFGTGWENSRHGTRGWLDTTMADLSLVIREKRFLKVLLQTALVTFETGLENLGSILKAAFRGRAFPQFDPNHWDSMRHSPEGLSQIPLSITPSGERSSPRERLLAISQREGHRDRLHIRTGVSVTEVLLAANHAGNQVGGLQARHRATGIRCLPREHAYEADPRAQPLEETWRDELVDLYCKPEGEVILCGGTFNTPQLLMLSGIGREEQLRSRGIALRVPLAGVGQNLQDRYEVPVIATITDRFRSLDGLALTSYGPDAVTDPLLNQWRNRHGWPARQRGIYATNGGLLAVMKRSQQEKTIPDLFMFALAGSFPGYSVGWSKPSRLAPGPSVSPNPDAAADHKRSLTWLLLKARTRNQGGSVQLRDAHPFRRPEINFGSFPGAPDDHDLVGKDADLEALFEGVQFVERILQTGVEKGSVESFEMPGIDRFDGNRRRWIKHVAWGHHACGTCRIGANRDPGAVVDSRLRVRGVVGLRVVDASVFPRIPGYFIVTDIYMVAEKAADMVSEDHAGEELLTAEVQRARQLDPVLPSRSEFQDREVFAADAEQAEAELILKRREAAGIEAFQPTHPKPTPESGR